MAGARPGRDGSRTPRLVVLDRLRQLLTGVHHPRSRDRDRLADWRPTQGQVTIAAIVPLRLERHCKMRPRLAARQDSLGRVVVCCRDRGPGQSIPHREWIALLGRCRDLQERGEV
jgi:hypothetical protein